MFAVTLYSLFRFLHVVIAIVAMGPHFAIMVLFRHMGKHPESAPALVPVLGRLAKFPKHGGMAMLLTGVLMVALNPTGFALFKQPWLALSLALFIVNVALGAGKVEPAVKELGAALSQGPVKPEQVTATLKKVNATFHIMTAVLVVIIVLMIFRPAL